jgi:hypothetical protein
VGRTLRAPLVLDGEIVALDDKGEPAGFQQLQGRIHLHAPSAEPARLNPRDYWTYPTTPWPSSCSTSSAMDRPTGAIGRSSNGAAERYEQGIQERKVTARSSASATMVPRATAARCTTRRLSHGWRA